MTSVFLRNTLSAAERGKKIDEAGRARVTLSFYKYHPIPDPGAFRDDLFQAWDNLDVLGRIYVAQEGINAQLSLPADNLGAFREHLESLRLEGAPFLKGVRLNIAIEQDNKSFLKLKIKVRNKIVADGIEDESFDPCKVGVRLDARDFNDIIADTATVLVDMRNHFESEIGHFRGAIRPNVDTFRESLGIIEADLEKEKHGKNLVLYCTGGIRCEKAGAYFRHKGFEKVFQLEGGIIEYLRQAKVQGLENKFMGKNFVFDGRMAERISEHVVSTCHLCGEPSDTHVNCGNRACHMLFIQCRSCSEKLAGCCSEACREVDALPPERQKEMRKGRGAPKKYFKRPASGN